MHGPVEPVRSSITESSQAFLKLTAAGNLMVMAGSPKIGQIATQNGENNVVLEGSIGAVRHPIYPTSEPARRERPRRMGERFRAAMRP